MMGKGQSERERERKRTGQKDIVEMSWLIES